VRDLESIHEYVARDSAIYADLVLHRLVHSAERLREFPDLGRVVPEVAQSSIRELIVSPFRLVYRTQPKAIEVVTVFHASRLFPAPP
jgi:toxin ParE1/3/4